MFKLLMLCSLFAMTMARPGFLHSAPLLTSTYHQDQHLVQLPTAVHLAEPLVTTHQIVTPIWPGSNLGYDLHQLSGLHHGLLH